MIPWLHSRATDGVRRVVMNGLVICASVACTQGTIVRVRSGQSYEERAIDPRAYSAYARGRLYEARGDTTHATEQYNKVLVADPNATEAWVRLGALRCVSDPGSASDAWGKAEHLDPELPQLWLERSRCELKHGRYEESLKFANLALRFEPSSVAGASLIASATAKLNRPHEGIRWLWGAAALNPTSADAWQLLLGSAELSEADRRYAARQLTRLRPPEASSIAPAYSTPADAAPSTRTAWVASLEQDFQQALVAGDISESRRIATLLGINPNQLAERALSSGSYAIALSEADLILNVDDTNALAWIVGLVAADRIGDGDKYAALLRRAPSTPIGDDKLLQAWLLDLLGCRVAASTEPP